MLLSALWRIGGAALGSGVTFGGGMSIEAVVRLARSPLPRLLD
jgi:hypothetical protein